jgi:ribosomal protein L11 methyltransferase
MQWMELSISCGPDQVQSLTGIMEKYGQGGASVEEWEEAGSTHQHYTIKIYIPFSRAYRNVREDIAYQLAASGYQSNLHEKVLQQNEWFESLRKNFKVIEIGEHFVIKPSWTTEKLFYPGRVIIEMDPGEAFGDGMHPTTRLCLLNLHKYLKPGMSVFDLGTGTGILAIAAVKLGAGLVVACDIDAVAVKTAKSNARVNQAEGIEFKRGTLSRNMQNRNRNSFDIVLANITSRAISDLSAAMVEVLKPEGTLIVSGIHPDGLDEVLIRLAVADLTFKAVEQDQDWYAVIARKA